MKKTKLYAWGAALLASLTIALAVSGGCSSAEAAPLKTALDAPGNTASAVLQVVDNKGPWANNPQAAQFGQWFEFNDAYDYVAATNWTQNLTETGTGEGDPALNLTTGVKGGALVCTNDDADNDRVEITHKQEMYYLEAGDKLVFNANITTGSDVTEVDLAFGIGITDNDFLGDTAVISDGIFFEKNDGDAYLDLVCAKDAAATSDYTRQAALYTLAASTTYKLTFVVEVNSSDSTKARIRAFVNNSQVYSGYVTTDIPNDEYLCIIFGIQNGAAASKSVTVNSIGCAESY